MRQIKTVDSDLSVVEGVLQITSGRDCLRQTTEQRLSTSRGEWRYDLTHGVPFIQQIADQSDLDLIRAIYLETLLETPGIVRVEQLQLSRDPVTRELSLSGTAIGEDGSTVTFAEVKIGTPTNG